MSSEAPSELLAILEPRLATEALAQLRLVANVTQVLAPRLALVQADPEGRSRAAALGGLHLYEGVISELPPDLTPSERVFIAAWEARRRTKTRIGEGLSWDAPGFLPPDAPTNR
jgi:hypothetical protein